MSAPKVKIIWRNCLELWAQNYMRKGVEDLLTRVLPPLLKTYCAFLSNTCASFKNSPIVSVPKLPAGVWKSFWCLGTGNSCLEICVNPQQNAT